MINKKAIFGVISLTIVGSLSVVSSSKRPLVVDAAAQKIDIDYSSSQWNDHSPGEKWDIDPELGIFEFNKNNVSEYDFTANTIITHQADNRESTITMSANFQCTITSAQIASDPESKEVQIGLVPWYIDGNNWLMVYAGFKKVKDGHIFDVNSYAKINGSTFVEYYVKDEGNRWISPGDPSCIEWHSAWPDGINGNMIPTTLEETEPDPSDEINVWVRKTRKTFAGKSCDSIFVRINGYELNYGRDNFMFSGFSKYEEEHPTANPGFGIYVMHTGRTLVSGLEVSISHDIVLPVPTVEPIGTIVKTGNVGSKVAIPDFIAYDNYGESIPFDVQIYNPRGQRVYMDGDNYFIPTDVGEHNVSVVATDSSGYTGSYDYVITVKDGKGHIDNDLYDDFLTYTPVDVSIGIAKGIMIGVPIAIALYAGFKVTMSIIGKKRKDK